MVWILAQIGDTAPFNQKPLIRWTVDDVSDWLDSLYLSEYKHRFARSKVNGSELLKFDRSSYTQLGVTRIAHRITIENSLKKFKPNTTAFWKFCINKKFSPNSKVNLNFLKFHVKNSKLCSFKFSFWLFLNRCFDS